MCALAVSVKPDLAAEILPLCADAIYSLGSDSLLPAVHRLLVGAVALDSVAVLQMFKDKRPRVLYCQPASPDKTWEAYTAGPYLFDPIYQHFMAGAPPGVYRLADIAPAEYLQSDFFKGFIASHDNSDERDLLVPTVHGWAFVLMLTRGQHAEPFSAADIQTLRAAQPLVTALLRRHAVLSPGSLEPEVARDLVQRKIDATMRHFASSMLTPREHAVLRYLMGGYSSNLIGERLGIAEGTVKIHRRNIHMKLDLTSQAELLALFIHCIPLADPDGDADPLVAYHSKRSAGA